ncbi:glycosyltransferase [Winogradskyella sp. 3972H.M.0a.05]|uniref:glycosyltransferase family 2 protein n=1 Tax=Winogradskyella sp. 3972H.M.0a.05 TaxID=2950277 RepID=UPI00339725AA
MKDVSVIIINYNTASYTLKCIETVINKTASSVSYEIIVVDNASELDDYNDLKSQLPKRENVSLYRSKVNTGFGGGNMFGAAYASSKYLLFLNSDAFFLNDCMSLLFNFMESNPKVGVITAQNYDEDGKFVPSFDHNKRLRRLLFGRRHLEKRDPKKYPNRKLEYETPLEVNWVNGALMFFRSDAFNLVGGFDTNIFLYFEEMDICQRLLNAGYKTMLVSEAKIEHIVGASTKKSMAIVRESFISYLYVIRKNYGFFNALIIRLYLIVSMLFKPKKWKLIPLFLNPNMRAQSLKNKQ